MTNKEMKEIKDKVRNMSEKELRNVFNLVKTYLKKAESKRIERLKQQLSKGTLVKVLDRDFNDDFIGEVVRVKRTRAIVLGIDDKKRWNVHLSMLEVYDDKS